MYLLYLCDSAQKSDLFLQLEKNAMTIKIKQRDLSYLWFPDQLFKYGFEYINIVPARISLIKSPF